MRQFLLTCIVLALTACRTAASTPAAAGEQSATATSTAMAEPSTEPPAQPEDTGTEEEEVPVSRAFAAEQEARLDAQLAPFRARVEQGSQLPRETTFGPTGIITGVRHDVAVAWVTGAEADLRALLERPEWRETELKGFADLVRQRVDEEIHENQMPVQAGGVVSPETVQRYIEAFRAIVSYAKQRNDFRVTFEVITRPKGAKFELCREYFPNDCMAVGTNVKLADVFRGRYIYRITLGGYHDVEAPLNLVNFGQTRLRCPLRLRTDVAGGIPCTPE